MKTCNQQERMYVDYFRSVDYTINHNIKLRIKKM